jgi:acetylglutamate kinase
MKVVKLGGSLLEDVTRRDAALRTIARQWKRGEPIVLVHGGGKHVDAKLASLGIPKRTHAGLRITDDATLDVVVSVLAGSVNKMIVSELSAMHLRAAGISGSDASTLVAEVHEPIDGVDLGHVGRVHSANGMLIRAMLSCRIMPVVSSIAEGPDGRLLNVNADTAAAALAAALGAESLVFITDVAGLLDGSGNVVRELSAGEANALIESDVVTGGMRPKLLAALHAMNAGVVSVTIGDTKLVSGSRGLGVSERSTARPRDPETPLPEGGHLVAAR